MSTAATSTKAGFGCDCQERISAELVEAFRAKHPNAKDHKAQIGNVGLQVVGNALASRGYQPVEFTAMGQTKAGGNKLIRGKSSLMFSFCPHCGTPWKNGEEPKS